MTIPFTEEAFSPLKDTGYFRNRVRGHDIDVYGLKALKEWDHSSLRKEVVRPHSGMLLNFSNVDKSDSISVWCMGNGVGVGCKWYTGAHVAMWYCLCYLYCMLEWGTLKRPNKAETVAYQLTVCSPYYLHTAI